MSYEKKKMSLEEVKEDFAKDGRNPHKKDVAFLEFLEKLDWSKTEIYWKREEFGSSGRTGYLVVHFSERIEEQWNDSFQTWYGTGAWMS